MSCMFASESSTLVRGRRRGRGRGRGTLLLLELRAQQAHLVGARDEGEAEG